MFCLQFKPGIEHCLIALFWTTLAVLRYKIFMSVSKKKKFPQRVAASTAHKFYAVLIFLQAINRAQEMQQCTRKSKKWNRERCEILRKN